MGLDNYRTGESLVIEGAFGSKKVESGRAALFLLVNNLFGTSGNRYIGPLPTTGQVESGTRAVTLIATQYAGQGTKGY